MVGAAAWLRLSAAVAMEAQADGWTSYRPLEETGAGLGWKVHWNRFCVLVCLVYEQGRGRYGERL